MSAAATLLPYSAELFPAIARHIFTQQHTNPNNLSDLVILLPTSSGTRQMRQALLDVASENNINAFLAPAISTLRDWITENCFPSKPEENRYLRELLFTDVLSEHGELFESADPWKLSKEILAIFDQLSLKGSRLPDSRASLERQLAQAYGTQDPFPQLGTETDIIYRLWQTWCDLEAQGNFEDPAISYTRKLAISLDTACSNKSFLLAPPLHLSDSELDWIETLVSEKRLHLFLSGSASPANLHPDAINHSLITRLALDARVDIDRTATDRFLDRVYSQAEGHINERYRDCNKDIPVSPVANKIRIRVHDKAESEAADICRLVSKSLADGNKSIGLVTDDRRLARRVRALLERLDIFLDDSAGWALSTTSAATLIESWLAAIEDDFLYNSLLDILKSPFLLGTDLENPERAAVFRIEEDLVHRENIGSSLGRYLHAARNRVSRLGWSSHAAADIVNLLNTLDTASRQLASLRDRKTAKASDYLDALLDSFDLLGITDKLYNDPAGTKVLQLVRDLANAVAGSGISLTWHEFRTWLASSFESELFRPEQQGSLVRLLTLEQSQALRFDTLIIASADDRHVPGPGNRNCFLNDRVRHELGLRTWSEHYTANFYLVRQLLQASNNIYITYSNRENEDCIPSRWIKLLQTFHKLAYGDDLAIQVADQAALPAGLHNKGQTMPRPSLPGNLYPDHVSASSHQNLVDCPYRFLVLNCMQLSPPEEISEALQKADYGNHVHLCLEAFFKDKDRLPGPFVFPVTGSNRQQAIDCLNQISSAVFKRDLEQNFLHRGWLKRWQNKIPSYIDWLISHQQEWSDAGSEVKYEIDYHGLTTLKGKIDHIDTNTQGDFYIIDYKTGHIPAKADIEKGEAVQLCTYALMSPGNQYLAYMDLDSQPVRLKHTLDPDTSGDLVARVDERLQQVLTAIREGAELPAWGNAEACRYCKADGICRKEQWAR